MTTLTDRSLFIVLGAGASYDCVALKTDADEPDPSVTRVNVQYRPPLAKDLFSSGHAFDEILRKYPLATALSEEIRSRLRKSSEEQNATLEEILNELQSSPSLDTRRQVWEIPLYLQELLWTMSDKYVETGGTKFHTFVRRVLDSSFDRVLFLTLNYDLLLDRAISDHTRQKFLTMESYSPSGRKWALVKAHGSVNWGKPITNHTIPRGASSAIAEYQFISTLNSEPEFSEDTVVLHRDRVPWHLSFEPEFRFGEVPGNFLYPWMALPAKGKKEFFCLEQQVQHAKSFLSRCTHFLFLGFSGLDPHVIGLFREVQRPAQKLMVVCGGKEHARKTWQKLLQANTKLIPHQHIGQDDELLSDLGFSRFVESDAFQDFLNLE
jgi:hypothetical protein